MSTEYYANLTLTTSEVRALERANNAARRHGFENLNTSKLKSGLSAASVALSIIAVGCSATALAVAGAIASVVSALSVNEKDVIDTVLLEGEDALDDVYQGMLDSGATKVQIRAPMIEFPSDGVRFVQGTCIIQSVFVDGEWIPFG